MNMNFKNKVLRIGLLAFAIFGVCSFGERVYAEKSFERRIARIDKHIAKLDDERANNPVPDRNYDALRRLLELKKKEAKLDEEAFKLRSSMSDNDRQFCDEYAGNSLVPAGFFDDFFNRSNDIFSLDNPFKFFDKGFKGIFEDMDKRFSSVMGNFNKMLPSAEETALSTSKLPQSVVNLQQVGKPGIVVLDGDNNVSVDQGLDESAIKQLKKDAESKGLESAVNKLLKSKGYGKKLKELKNGYTVAVNLGNNQFFSCSCKTGGDGKNGFCSNSWSCSSFVGNKNILK